MDFDVLTDDEECPSTELPEEMSQPNGAESVTEVSSILSLISFRQGLTVSGKLWLIDTQRMCMEVDISEVTFATSVESASCD